MSKAIVKESDSEADLPYEPPAIPAGIKNYMAPQCHCQMQDELHQRCEWSTSKWSRGQVSWVSPVARALMKAHEDDIVEVRAPSGLEQIEVLEIRYGDVRGETQ